ncbi:unnamed protein product [Porites evermanni]|uniref:C2 domain-containing protein n=1 Tax=Porites evermanni TaxID=104178 RepID=A0ABN8M2Z1_9CNID|nr:unnamed protein product [Porites evermanni]
MPRIPSGHRHDSNTEDSFLGLTGGLLILLVTSSVLFLGALCKYLRKLCRKLKGKELWKRGSKKRQSKRGEKSKRSSSIRRSSSRASRTKEGLIVSPEFSIPSSRSTVTQQPAPDLSQGRTGRSNEEKRLSIMSLYLNEEMGELNPELYDHTERAVRIGKDKNLGQLNLKIRYNDKNRNLSVTLVSGKDFPPRDYSGSIDTCVTVCVLPHRERRKQSAIHRRSMSPPYNENFVFNIQVGEDAHSHSLLLVTYFYDNLSHSHVLGESQVPLIYCDFSGSTNIWCYLEESSDSGTSIVGALQSFANAECGELLLSLCYVTKDQTLTVAIMKGMNLTAGLLSCVEKVYTKATLHHDGQKLLKRKTGLQEVGDTYTVFNEALLFRVPEDKLPFCTLKISVNHYNVVGKSATVGEVIFSAESTGLEEAHWDTVTSKHDRAVSMWHTLRGFKFIETLKDDRQPLSPN